MNPIRLCLLTALLALSGCSAVAPHGLANLPGQSGAPRPAPLVPARMYVADWDAQGAYQLSPDGQRLMWMARKGLAPGLYVKDFGSGQVRSYAIPMAGTWAEDSRHILFNADRGDENSAVLEFDAAAPAATLRNLTPHPGRRATLHRTIEGSDDILIESNRRDARVFDLYRYQRNGERLVLVATNPGDVAHWLTDAGGRLRARVRKDSDGWMVERPDPTGADAWHQGFRVDLADTLRVLHIFPGEEAGWALSNRGRDKLALVRIDLRTGAETVFHADPEVDLSEAYISRKTGMPLAVASDPGHRVWTFFDPDLKARAGEILGAGGDRLDLTSFTRDGDRFTATVQNGEGGRHLLFDTRVPGQTVLGELVRSRIQAISPNPRQAPVRFTSRDGLALHGYVTVPVAADGAPLKRSPAVVYVHGGPWSRDLQYLDNMPFFLANRGYAVLQVNYRGSSGYGKAFEAAGLGEFAGKMHADLLDGVDYLVQQGLADPARVAIMGGSYGGYAAMVGMALTPGRFACGISLNGMSDLGRLLQESPPYWELGKYKFHQFAGDPADPEGLARLRASSPLYHAGKVQGPLLIVQGARDPRVKPGQSTGMVDALRRAGKPVQYVALPKAGHVLYRWPDQLRFYRATEDFLSRCLGGRSAGFDLFELGGLLF